MKILAISDHRLPEMEQQEFLRQNYSDVGFIISCGDLESSYLEFVTTVLMRPLYYVRGNHDDHYDKQPPGGQDLHLKFQQYKGVSMVGLEGAPFYNGKNVQYTEVEMASNSLKILPRLLIRRRNRPHGVDYLVTHAPPRGIHDRPDQAHQGFRSLLWLMRLARPRYLIHGHCDVWDRRTVTETTYRHTQVMNINPRRLLLPFPDNPPPRQVDVNSP